MFDTVLVANRGEIAIRVFKTLRRMGIRSVGVYSDVDAMSRHVREADTAVHLGPTPPHESYLNIERVIEAAMRSRAQAIHPGYGFLSENSLLVRACEQSGLVFIGPNVEAVEIMGDKIRAKLAVAAAGIPVVPGRVAPAMSDDELISAAAELGFPVLVKPAAGGGGRGMRLVNSFEDIEDAIQSARREALASFDDDTLFMERFVTKPRHIEVQVLSDRFGATVHLGERECSLQRRHQKVVEESPSILLNAATRDRITASAVRIAESVNYVGVGTVEFIVSADAPDDFYFMEMNTRLQVEHPVTELVTGVDLVEQQLRVANGERLSFTQEQVHFNGHAIEARLYAEDPYRNFLPTGGRVLLLRDPSRGGVRVDSSLEEGDEIPTTYDPLIAKIIAHGPERRVALARLVRALSDTVILGVVTNVSFLISLLASDDVVAGRLETGLIERDINKFVGRVDRESIDLAMCVASVAGAIGAASGASGRWDVPDGWRPGEHAPTRASYVMLDRSRVDVAALGATSEFVITLERLGEDATVVNARCLQRLEMRDDAHELLLDIDGFERRAFAALGRSLIWTWVNGVTTMLQVAEGSRRLGEQALGDGDVRTPMPGTVIALAASVGDQVEEGDRLAIIEAMKMENPLLAPFDGVVSRIFVSVGDQVAVDQIVVILAHTKEEVIHLENPATV